MDDSSKEEEEEVEESNQSNEERMIHALMKKLPKDKQIDMLVNMEQDF
jgi:hypothetical protein